MDRRDYWYWLASVDCLGVRAADRLLSLFETPENLFREDKLPVSDAQQLALQESRRQIDVLLREKENLGRLGIRWCCREDEEYPEHFRTLPDPPLGLFYKGKLPPENKPAVGIIGARSCSAYGRTMAERFGRELGADGISVISGMAVGIDGCAQSAALAVGGESYGVLGCGVDIAYPACNRKLYEALCRQGGVLSEYRPGTPPLSWHFPLRNRLISALSDVLLLMEAREKSGSLITVDLALEQNKDVLAVPGRLDDSLSAGCNRLIRQGAGILTSVTDVYDSLGIESPSAIKRRKSPSDSLLNTEQKQLLACLSSTPKHMEQLMTECEKSFGEMALLLLDLEDRGLICPVSSNQYVRR